VAKSEMPMFARHTQPLAFSDLSLSPGGPLSSYFPIGEASGARLGSLKLNKLQLKGGSFHIQTRHRHW
jgi:hypothetical protein